MAESTPLSGGNAAYLESLYEQYLRDPGTVPDEWRAYFAQIAERQAAEPAGIPASLPADTAATAKQAAVSRLIQIWINRGHLVAKVDPLGLMERPRPRVLALDYFGLSEADLDSEFVTGSRTA